MRVPMANLRKVHSLLKKEIDDAIERVFSKSSFILGEEVEAFEEEFANYTGASYAVGVGSCTDAIIFSLQALGIGDGDEVITTPLSAYPTAEAVLLVGATPVFADVRSDTLNICPTEVCRAITEKTKAVLPVHLYGRPADPEVLSDICCQSKLHLVEDCAQAHGAAVKRERVGTFGITGCFSFFPSKNLGGIMDGGMVTTNDREIADYIRALRNHGRRDRHEHHYVGRNSRMSGLQAAVLRVKLKYLDFHNTKRAMVAALYSSKIRNPHLTLLSDTNPDVSHVNHLFVVMAEDSSTRERFRKHMGDAGIATQIHYPIALHNQPAVVTKVGIGKKLPVVEDATCRIVSLPMHQVMTDEEVDYVIAHINSFDE